MAKQNLALFKSFGLLKTLFWFLKFKTKIKNLELEPKWFFNTNLVELDKMSNLCLKIFSLSLRDQKLLPIYRFFKTPFFPQNVNFC